MGPKVWSVLFLHKQESWPACLDIISIHSLFSLSAADAMALGFTSSEAVLSRRFQEGLGDGKVFNIASRLNFNVVLELIMLKPSRSTFLRLIYHERHKPARRWDKLRPNFQRLSTSFQTLKCAFSVPQGLLYFEIEPFVFWYYAKGAQPNTDPGT